MSPDDDRHGTHRGYLIGCREQCCTRAHTRYMKLYRLGRQPTLIDSTGTIRRIQALNALGWTSVDIGAHCGRGREWARMIARSKTVSTTTAALIASAYDALSMRQPPQGGYAERSRRDAERKGWAVPLAWDDDTIDDPAARPRRGSNRTPKHDVDPIVVERVLSGAQLPMTRAERFEVVTRARTLGWSYLKIEARTGITKPERYIVQVAS